MTPNYGEDRPYIKTPGYQTTQAEREGYWKIASSLQEADGLKVSGYANREALQYIAGDTTAKELSDKLETYHAQNAANITEEADRVAARIVELLETTNFVLRPATLVAIHKRLFDGIKMDCILGNDIAVAGIIRPTNFSKKEPVLGGHSVSYGDAALIVDSLEYDFNIESSKPYGKPFAESDLKRFCDFIANVWQTHAFVEGNTRTTAVFSELYLRHLGVNVSNEPFAGNGALYRDCLVRANFSDWDNGIYEDKNFLIEFYRSVIFKTPYPYKHSDLNIHGIRKEGFDDEYRPDNDFIRPDGVATLRPNPNVGNSEILEQIKSDTQGTIHSPNTAVVKQSSGNPS